MANPRANLLSTGTVARELGVSANTVKRWARSGRLEAVVLPSGHYRIPRSELERVRARAPLTGERAMGDHRADQWRHAEAWERAQPIPEPGLDELLQWLDSALELAARGETPIRERPIDELERGVAAMHRALAGKRD